MHWTPLAAEQSMRAHVQLTPCSRSARSCFLMLIGAAAIRMSDACTRSGNVGLEFAGGREHYC